MRFKDREFSKEKLRDKTRDDREIALRSAGVDAVMAERGRREEGVCKSVFRRSLGIIDIKGGLVAPINVLKIDASQYSPPQWWVVLLVPVQLPGAADHPVKVTNHRTKSLPLIGKVTSLDWRGEDYGSGLIESLNGQPELADPIRHLGDVEIESHAGEFAGWTIQVNARLTPEGDEWQTLAGLAKQLRRLTY